MKLFDCNTHIEKEPTSIRVRELKNWHADSDEGTITHYATVQDILSGMRKHGVAKSLVMPNSVTADKDDAKRASEMVANAIKGYEDLVGAACVHPYSKTAVYDLEDGIIEWGLKVLMLSPDRQGFELNDEALWILFERVEELKVPVMLYTQWSNDTDSYLNVGDLLDAASSFHINFILSHMGMGSDLSVISNCAEQKNIYFETSHIKQRDVLHAIDIFSSNRLVFGSDFSYNLYPKYELEKILNLEIDKSDKEKIVGKNLEKLLK